MHRATTVLLLALLLLAAPLAAKGPKRPRLPTLRSKERRELLDLFERYVEAGDAGRPAILAEVSERDPIPDSAVKDLVKKLFGMVRNHGPRVSKDHRQKLDHPDYPGTFLISGAKRGRPKGLLVGLHGGGAGSGDGATAAQKWQAATGKDCIAVFPTVIEKVGSAWNQEREERYVLELIEAVKRTYPVDTNRIYLVGHSMGGYGTWSIGGHHADLFAAISPNAGGVFGTVSGGKVVGLVPGVLPNLMNTPIYITHGADDPRVRPDTDRLAAKRLAELKAAHPGGYEFEYHEYENIGHGLPPKGTQPILEWLTSRKRDPYPKKVVWEPVVPYKRSFYWLRCERQGRGRLIVAVNEGENRFSVETKGTAEDLALFLNGEMIDPKDPVKVTLNGETVFDGFAMSSATAILLSIAERNDRSMYFTMRVPLEKR